MRKVEFWLVSTDHLEDRLLFRDVEDFTVGMNIVAVQANKRHVKVLVFILMSNHLHFVLLCTREEAEAFVNGCKLEFSRYLHKKYGCSEHLRRNGVDIRLIPQENEALERALAYVQMNCVAANICGSPRAFLPVRWTGCLMCRQMPGGRWPVFQRGKGSGCCIPRRMCRGRG